jgi:hypothetical protein
VPHLAQGLVVAFDSAVAQRRQPPAPHASGWSWLSLWLFLLPRLHL